MPHHSYPRHGDKGKRRRGTSRAVGKLVSFAPTAPLTKKLEPAAPTQPTTDPSALSRAIEFEKRDRERRAAFAKEAERQALAEKKEAERRAAAVREEERRALLAQIVKAPKEDRARLLEEARLNSKAREIVARIKREEQKPIDRVLVGKLFGIAIEID